MKKRIVSTVLLVVLLLGLALTVSAACDHTYMYICDYSVYEYMSDYECEYVTYSRETCTKCHDNKDTRISGIINEHSFSAPVYVGTLASGIEWWYHDCINCGARIDFYE
jgi:polyferredoxin